LTLTLRASANVPPGDSVIPATLTDPPPAATVAVPLGGGVAETIVKPDGAVSESEPKDVPFDAGFANVAVIPCADVPAVTGDGVRSRRYLQADAETVVVVDDDAASMLAATPVPTGEPLHTAEPQPAVAAVQLMSTLRFNANVPPGANVIPATVTDPPPTAIVAVPVRLVAATILKPAGAVSDTEPNDVVFDEGFVYVAVIDCADVPAVTGDGVTRRPYVHGDDKAVVIVDRPAWNAKGTPPTVVGVLPVEA